MKKIIPLLILLCFIGFVSAETKMVLDPWGVLANLSYKDTSSVVYSINISGNSSTYKCSLYTNDNGSYGPGAWRAVEIISNVPNQTATNFSTRTNLLTTTGPLYCWSVFCNSTSDPIGNMTFGNATGCYGTNSGVLAGGGMNFTVDTEDPVVTINSPADATWFGGSNELHKDNTSVRINLTVIDNNTGSCVIGTLNITDNQTNSTTIFHPRYYVYAYTHNTMFNVPLINLTIGFSDDAVRTYRWTYTCNDSAGNTVSLGSNYSWYVDTSKPTAFDFDLRGFGTPNRVLWNDSTATDFNPIINWTLPTEANFSHYEILFYNETYTKATGLTSGGVGKNITTNTTTNISMETLAPDRTYKILITAYDLAGNARNISTLHYTYSTDSTNRELSAGWNILGNVGYGFNLTHALNWSGATTAAIWNRSHEWEAHTVGGSWAHTPIHNGTPFLLYLSAAINFSDLVWNKSNAIASQAMNLSNNTNSNWNLVMNTNWTDTDGKTFQEIDNSLNTFDTAPSNNSNENVSYFSYYNNSASSGSKYVSYKANWSIVNATRVEFGECIWLFLNDDRTSYTAGGVIVNNTWTNITKDETYQQMNWELIG